MESFPFSLKNHQSNLELLYSHQKMNVKRKTLYNLAQKARNEIEVGTTGQGAHQYSTNIILYPDNFIAEAMNAMSLNEGIIRLSEIKLYFLCRQVYVNVSFTPLGNAVLHSPERLIHVTK